MEKERIITIGIIVGLFGGLVGVVFISHIEYFQFISSPAIFRITISLRSQKILLPLSGKYEKKRNSPGFKNL